MPSEHRGRRFGNQIGAICAGLAQQRRDHRDGGDEADDHPLVDVGRGPPQAGQHDDERFADEQQQIGGAARHARKSPSSRHARARNSPPTRIRDHVLTRLRASEMV